MPHGVPSINDWPQQLNDLKQAWILLRLHEMPVAMHTSCKLCVSGSVSWGSATLLLASPSAAETTAIEEVLLWGTTPGRLAIFSCRCNECDLVDKKSKFEDLLVLRCHVATGVELGQIVVCIGRTILLCLDWTLSGAPYCIGFRCEGEGRAHHPYSQPPQL